MPPPDKKNGVDTTSDGKADYYSDVDGGVVLGLLANVDAYNDYYAFGMPLPGRTFTSSLGYRYGFNGKEKDSEWNNGGAMYDYGFRIYDPRIAKFLSVDPLTKRYPYFTPYQFASNSPIQAIDVDGLEGVKIIDHQNKRVILVTNYLYVEKTADNKDPNNSKRFTKEEIELFKTSMNDYLKDKSFVDESHKAEDGSNYKVELQFNFIRMNSEKEINAQIDPNDAQNNNVHFYYDPPYSDGKNGIVGGGATSGTLGLSRPMSLQSHFTGKDAATYMKLAVFHNAHKLLHEVFHNLIHVHPIAPKEFTNQIDSDAPEKGHKDAGGIFQYSPEIDLNQKNINDALKVVPEQKKGEE